MYGFIEMKSTSKFQKKTLSWCRFHNTAATKNLSKNIDIEVFNNISAVV